MATIDDIIQGAGRLIGIRDWTDSDRQDEALAALNGLLQSMRRSMHHAPVEENFTLTASTSEYTIGSGGDFDTDRPIRIISAFIRNSDDNDYHLDIISKEDYDKIFDKDVDERAEKLYYAPENSSGLAKIFLNSAYSTAEDLYISSIKPYDSYSLWTNTFLLPVEYEDPIKYLLAIRLAPEYNLEPSGYVTQQAGIYQALIETENSEPPPLAEIPVELRRAS